MLNVRTIYLFISTFAFPRGIAGGVEIRRLELCPLGTQETSDR